LAQFCSNFQGVLSDRQPILAVMEERWTPSRQGDAGELSAMCWLASQGAFVFIPVGHSPHVDLIADFGTKLVRVQVKTSTFQRKGRWEVLIATRGGNQSWTGTVKRLDPSRCETLFVHVGDGRRWYIPTEALDAGTNIVLGGPKYTEFEVEPGDPLPARLAADQAAAG
jgi:hypothetical protein